MAKSGASVKKLPRISGKQVVAPLFSLTSFPLHPDEVSFAPPTADNSQQYLIEKITIFPT
jgi:hypothetical protein